MRIAVTGSTGLVGSEVVRFFRARGDHVTRIVRSYSGLPANERAIVWNPREGTIEAEGLRGHDVIIHLAGESIASVWTPGRKRRIEESRVAGTTLLARTIAALPELPRVLLSASAMGYYGSRGGPVDETAKAGTGFLADVAQKWEAATAAAERSGVRVVHMRFGNVLSREGGTLAALLPIFKLGLGAKFGSGSQCWPWIALPEMGPAMLHLIEHADIAGAVNFAAPERTTNAELTTALARAVGRPTLLTVPPFAAKLAPGGMGQELLLGGACLVPRRLLESGYAFRHPSLAPALTALLHG